MTHGEHPPNRALEWVALAYGGDLFSQQFPAQPHAALQMLKETPELVENPYLACAACDEARVRHAVEADPAWFNQPSPSLKLLPLPAVTMSSLAGLPELRASAHACARLLLEAGADPNQSWQHEHGPLSALYGAAGRNHDPEMTRILLAAGANPNDNESLYHSTETRDHSCTRLLLEAGARVEGSNALAHMLDREDPEGLRLLLQYTKNADDPGAGGRPLLWAIRRRRSAEVFRLLLEAGADPVAKNKQGHSPYQLALRYGLPDAAKLLADAAGGDAAEGVSEEDRFVAACARGDRDEARRIQERRPDLPRALSHAQLHLLPELAETGHNDGVRVMVELGWPLDVRGGDWSGTALNMAVFHGNVELTKFLLEHGASWTEGHGFGDNVCGTLSWASCNNGPGHDWVGIARLLVTHGMPGAEPLEDSGDPRHAGCVRIGGKIKRFSEEVTEFLLEHGRR